MMLLLSYFLSALFFIPLKDRNIAATSCQVNFEQLNLSDAGRKIENTIHLNINKSDLELIKAVPGEKARIKANTLIINGDTLKPREIVTRGKSTLNFRRKSYGFSLDSKATFHKGESKKSMKKFYVVSLSMDKYYTHNRLAFEMMETTHFFDLFYSFCELTVNGRSEGIGMVLERPEDWARNKKDSPFLIRRGYDHTIDEIKTDKKITKAEANKYSDSYNQIYKSLKKYHGEELYNILSGLLDLEVYMKWIAFNTLVRNGDYTDEVCFYFDPAKNKFSIIPWDYDDLFSTKPHEVLVGGYTNQTNKFIFSTEDLLDQKIASDPFLYNIYLGHLREITDQLSPSVLKRIFENTYTELFPYFSKGEIISMSRYDLYKDVDLEKLKTEMVLMYQFLTARRNLLLNSQ